MCIYTYIFTYTYPHPLLGRQSLEGVHSIGKAARTLPFASMRVLL